MGRATASRQNLQSLAGPCVVHIDIEWYAEQSRAMGRATASRKNLQSLAGPCIVHIRVGQFFRI